MDISFFRLKTLLFLIIFIFFNLCKNENVFETISSFPYIKTLLNGNNVLIDSLGIHFFNSDLSIEDDSKKIIFGEQILTSENYCKTVISQFSLNDGGYIMILIMNKIYFFQSDGTLLTSTPIDLSSIINSAYYNLTPYKKDGNYLYYIISYTNMDNKKLILHCFKFNYDSIDNENVISKEFDIVGQQYNYQASYLSGGSCTFLLTSSEYNILVCFYAFFYPTEIHSRAFDPSNDFEEITEYYKTFYENDNVNFYYYLSVFGNSENNKAFIILNNGDLFSLIYDFDNFFFNKIKLGTEEFSGFNWDFNRNQFTYFTQTNEFTFISSKPGNPQITIMIFNNDFTLKEFGFFYTVEDVYGINTASCYYNGVNYGMVYDDYKDDYDASKKPILSGIIENLNPVPNEAHETFIKNIKCKTANYESSQKDLCTECDNDNGYYSVEYPDNSFLDGFLECFNISPEPSYFYFDSSNQVFKQCYQTCKTCDLPGDADTHNCKECENNYIKQPDIPDTTNCVLKCNYMYYYTSYGQYKCTENSDCPEEVKFLISELNKCTHNCKNEEIYKYKYGGKCLINCPENTEPNDDNNCIDININLCTKTEREIEQKDELDINEIDLNSKNYAEEFSYTTKHVAFYYNNLYSILIYKDAYCIDELSLYMPKVDFSSCFKKVLQSLYPSTTDNIIITLVEKLNPHKKSNTAFYFYHPNTGEKIDISTICKDEEFVVKESVLAQINNSNVDMESAIFLTEQNINIFNISDAFYTDICFHFNSPNGKDIPLKDRVQTYYPNISLCDPGCEIKGVNLTTMESICECKLNELLNFGDNALIQNTLGELTNLLSSSNIMVLKCYKDLLEKKFFIKNTGGFIIIGIISIEIASSILFFALDVVKIIRYLYNLTEYFIKSISSKKKIIRKDNYITINNTENAPPKKKEKKKNEKKENKRKTRNKNYNENNLKIVSFDNDNDNGNNNDTEKNDNKNTLVTVKGTDRTLCKSSLKIKTKTTLQKTIKDNDLDLDMEEYLKSDLDDMEYDDAIKYDNRTFCLFYWERLKEKQMIINFCCNDDFLKPKTMKLLILLLNIDLYFVANGLFYNEEYISDLFHSIEEETFFSFLKRSIERIVYVTIVGTIIENIIAFIFIEEKKIKKIFIREKDNFIQLKYQIFKIIKSIKIRYIIFIILCFIIAIFSFYYVNCFNNVYSGIKKEWIKSSIVIIIIMQLLPLLLAFIEALLRLISFKCKSEKVFDLRKYFS